MTARKTSWHDMNQDQLGLALAEVRAALERRLEGAGGSATRSESQAVGAPEPNGGVTVSSLQALASMFDLTPFERRILVLCAGMELDPSFPALCAAAQGDPSRPYPTFGLCLAALPEAHWSALAPTAALRHWRLVDVASGASLAASPLRIDERILHYLLGVGCVDERLATWLAPVTASGPLPPSQQAMADQVAEVWRLAGGAPATPVLHLGGDDPAGKRAVAAAACASLGIRLHGLAAAELPGSAAESESLARLWEREAILSNSALLVDGDSLEGADETRVLQGFVERLHGAVLVSAREPVRLRKRIVMSLDINKPDAGEQRALWQESLGPLAKRLNGDLDRVTAQFHLGRDAIRSASLDVVRATSGPKDGTAGVRLWQACRALARPRLDDLAQRLTATATWDDLVLPPGPREVLHTIAAHVRRRSQVYESWGFASKGPRGLGISALFSGVSGTGKTLAAEVLANDLGLDLYRIDLSAMVSKYVGETEKNLRRVFDAAEEGGAILLFDEADALFGKRSEVKDSHDRYANIEISYLLQRVEAYRGLVVLTSNMRSGIDPAFLRRLRFVVTFPFPDAVQRTEIWQRVFTPRTPTQGLDFARLARLALSGGNIRNLALNAAFLAADAGEPVRMTHLLRSARAEYAKLEKPLAESEIGGWE